VTDSLGNGAEILLEKTPSSENSDKQLLKKEKNLLSVHTIQVEIP
jgi:hypothetical protein